MKKRCFVWMTVMLAALVAACSSVRQAAYDMPGMGRLASRTAGFSVDVGEPFVIAMSDQPLSHGHYSFPKVRKLPTGELFVAFGTIRDVVKIAFFSVDGAGSDLISTTVKSPVILQEGGGWVPRLPEPYASQGLSVPPIYKINTNIQIPHPIFGWTEFRDGSVMGFDRNVWRLNRTPGDRDSEFHGVGYGMLVRADGTSDGPFGSFFEIPDLDRTARDRVLRISGHGLELEDGSFVIPVDSIHVFPYKLEGGRGYATFLYQSTDQGRTFRPYALVARTSQARGAREGPSEPDLVRLPSGDFMVVTRTGSAGSGNEIMQSEPMLAARSSDQGKTWSVRRMGRRGVNPALIVMSHGILVLAHGRPGNQIAFSEDEGRSWVHSTMLSPAQQPTSGYTDVLEIEPGRLLVVYDVREYQPPGEKLWAASQGYNAVLGRYITVKRAE